MGSRDTITEPSLAASLGVHQQEAAVGEGAAFKPGKDVGVTNGILTAIPDAYSLYIFFIAVK